VGLEANEQPSRQGEKSEHNLCIPAFIKSAERETKNAAKMPTLHQLSAHSNPFYLSLLSIKIIFLRENLLFID
jgi:hypothetical protein